MSDHKTIYKKEVFRQLLDDQFANNNIEYGTNGTGYIDDDFDSVFDCICDAFKELTEDDIK